MAAGNVPRPDCFAVAAHTCMCMSIFVTGMRGKTAIRLVYAVLNPPGAPAQRAGPHIPPLGGTVVGYGRRTIRTQLSSLTNSKQVSLLKRTSRLRDKGKLQSRYKNGEDTPSLNLFRLIAEPSSLCFICNSVQNRKMKLKHVICCRLQWFPVRAFEHLGRTAGEIMKFPGSSSQMFQMGARNKEINGEPLRKAAGRRERGGAVD